jgi:hypothetical protein
VATSTSTTTRTAPGRRPGDPFRHAAPVDEPAAVGDDEDLDDDEDQDDEPEDVDDDEDQDDEPEQSGRGGRSIVSEGAGAMLAVFLYPLLINLLNGGPPQMWGWVKAKFINEPYGGATPAGGPGTQTAQGHLAPTPSGYQPANPYITG